MGAGLRSGLPWLLNPETHAFDGGEVLTVEQAYQTILAAQNGLEGLTISGGEPMHQHRALTALLKQVRRNTPLSVLVFSGYTWEEIHKFPGAQHFLDQIDVLIAGRFEVNNRMASALIGSANKTVHFLTPRYQPLDLEQVPQAEVIVMPDGEIRLSGIDPLKW